MNRPRRQAQASTRPDASRCCRCPTASPVPSSTAVVARAPAATPELTLGLPDLVTAKSVDLAPLGTFVVAREGAGIRRPAANGQAARLEIPAYETPFGPPRTLLDVNNIVICGHADCEPVKGAMSPESVEPLPYGGPWLEYVDTGQTHDLDDAIEANVLAQLDHLRTYDFISEAIAAGSLALSGCV